MNETKYFCDVCGDECEEGNNLTPIIERHFKNLPSALQVSTSIVIVDHNGESREADICSTCLVSMTRPAV